MKNWKITALKMGVGFFSFEICLIHYMNYDQIETTTSKPFPWSMFSPQFNSALLFISLEKTVLNIGSESRPSDS